MIPDIIKVGKKQKRKIVFYDTKKNKYVSMSFLSKMSSTEIVELAAKGDPLFFMAYPNLYKKYIYGNFKHSYSAIAAEKEFRELFSAPFTFNLMSLPAYIFKKGPFLAGDIRFLNMILGDLDLKTKPNVTIFKGENQSYLQLESKKGRSIVYLYPVNSSNGLVGMIEYDERNKYLVELLKAQFFAPLKWVDSGYVHRKVKEKNWNAFTMLDYLKNVTTASSHKGFGPFNFYGDLAKFAYKIKNKLLFDRVRISLEHIIKRIDHLYKKGADRQALKNKMRLIEVLKKVNNAKI